MVPAPAPTPPPALALTPSSVALGKRKRSPDVDPDVDVDLEVEERQISPDQPLPSWMSWALIPLTDPSDGHVTGTATWLVELPQLYTGASIPLEWPWTAQTGGVGPDGGVQVSVIQGQGGEGRGVITLGGTGAGAVATVGEPTRPPASSGGVSTTRPTSSPSGSSSTTSPPSSSSTSQTSRTSSSSSTTSTAGASPPMGNHSHLSTGAIVGIALGSFALFLIIVISLAAFLVRRRRAEARRSYMARTLAAGDDDGSPLPGSGGEGGRRAWIGPYRDHPELGEGSQPPEAGWKAGAEGATLAGGATTMGNLPPRSSADGQTVDAHGLPVGMAMGSPASAAFRAAGRHISHGGQREMQERDLGDAGSSSYAPTTMHSSRGGRSSGRGRGLGVPSNVHLASGPNTPLRSSARGDDDVYDPEMTSPVEGPAGGERAALLGGAARPRGPRMPHDDPEWLGPSTIARAVGAYEVGRRMSKQSSSRSGSRSTGTGRGGSSSGGRTGTTPSSGVRSATMADASTSGTGGTGSDPSVMTDDLFAVPPGNNPRQSVDEEAWRYDIGGTGADKMGKDAIGSMGVLAGGTTAAAAARRRMHPDIREENESLSSASIDDPHGDQPKRRRSTDLPPYTPRDGYAPPRPSASTSRSNLTSAQRSHLATSSFSSLDDPILDHQGRQLPHLVGHGSGWSTTFSPPVPYFPHSDIEGAGVAPVQGGGRVISITPEAFSGHSREPSSSDEGAGGSTGRPTKRISSIMGNWAPGRWGVTRDDEIQSKRVSTIQEGSEVSHSNSHSGNSGSGSGNGSNSSPGANKALLNTETGGGTAGPLSAAGIGGLFGGLRALVGGGDKRNSASSQRTSSPQIDDEERGEHRHPIVPRAEQRVTTSAMGFPEADLERLANTETRGEPLPSHVPETGHHHSHDDSSELSLHRHPEEDSSQIISSAEGPAAYGEPNRWSHATMGQRIRDGTNQTSSSSGGHSSGPSRANTVSTGGKGASGSGSRSGSGEHGSHNQSTSGSNSHEHGSGDSGSRPGRPEAIQEERSSQIVEVPEVLSPV